MNFQINLLICRFFRRCCGPAPVKTAPTADAPRLRLSTAAKSNVSFSTERGVWSYCAETNALKLLAEADHRSATTAGQDFVHSAPVTLIFAVNQAKTERISGGRAGAICQSVDVGVMVQNALLACSAMGLAAVPRAWFEPQTVLQALGLTSYDPQMAVTVGFPK